MHFLFSALFAASVQTIVVPAQPHPSVRLHCPKGATTRVLLPEPLRQVRLGPEAKEQLGVSIEQTKPLAVLSIVPRAHPARASIEFRGPHLVLTLVLDTLPSGEGAEIHLVREAPAPRTAPSSVASPLASMPSPQPTAPALEPVPELSPAPSPSPSPVMLVAGPAPEPAFVATMPSPIASPTPSLAFDVGDLMRATPVPIGRREGLPGQLPLVLVDALKGESYVWLRFTLEGGAQQRVKNVSWQRGAISAYTQEPVGKDLRIVVQLPRAEVDRKARVQLEVGSGAQYRVSLNASTLAGFLKSLFQ